MNPSQLPAHIPFAPLAAALALLLSHPVTAAEIQLPTDLAVWLRSTDVTTSGSTVTGWNDLSGNGFDAALFAGGPTIVNSAINGLPAVNFGGGGEYRYTGSIGLGGGFTAFIVGQDIGATNNERALQLGNIATGSITGSGSTTVAIDINSTGGGNGAGTRYNNGNNLFSPGWNSDTSTYHITEAAMPDASSYNSSTYALNGTPGSFITSTNPGNTVNFTGANDLGFTLGRGVANGGGVADALTARIAEVIIFREVLSAADLNTVGYYLMDRYDLPGAYTAPTGDFYFDNFTGNGDWNTGANWDAGVRPTSINDTFINGGLTADLSATGAATNNLTVGSESTGGPNTPGIGTLNITGGDLTVGQTLRVGGDSNATRGTVEQSGGSVTVANDLIFGGDTTGGGTQSQYRISGGGTLDVSGDIAHAPGAMRGHLYVDAPNALTVSGDIEIQSFRTGDSAGGSHTVNPGQTLTTTGTLLVGRAAQGQLTLLSTGNSAANMRVGETTGSAGSILTLDNGASLTVGSTSVGTAGSGDGTLNVIDGTLVATNTLFIAGDATGAGNTSGHLIVGDGITNPTVTVASNLEVGRGGAGGFTLNSGTVNVTGANFVLAQTGGSGSAQATISGGTLNVGSPGGNNQFNVNSGTGGATVDHTGGTVNVAQDLRLANNNATTGSRIYNLDGGTLNVGRHLRLGDNGSATLNYESGTLTIGSVLYLGGSESTSAGANPSADGTLNIGTGGGTPTLTTGQFEVGRHRIGTVNHANGTVNVNATHNLVISQYANATGTYNLTGGTLNVGVGPGSQGNMNFNSGTGTFNQSDGTVNLNGNHINLTNNAAASATYNLSGGTLDLGGGNVNSGPGTTAFNFTGGTLKDVNHFNLSLDQQGGVLQVGPDSGAGTMLINGDYFLSSGQLSVTHAGSSNGRLTVNGDVIFGSATLDIDWTGSPDNFYRGVLDASNMAWILEKDTPGQISGTFANSTPSFVLDNLFGTTGEAHWINIDGQPFALFYNSQADVFGTAGLTGGNDILLIAIPEPSRTLLLAVAIAPLLLRRHRPQPAPR